jgi:hypothetical protein
VRQLRSREPPARRTPSAIPKPIVRWQRSLHGRRDRSPGRPWPRIGVASSCPPTIRGRWRAMAGVDRGRPTPQTVPIYHTAVEPVGRLVVRVRVKGCRKRRARRDSEPVVARPGARAYGRMDRPDQLADRVRTRRKETYERWRGGEFDPERPTLRYFHLQAEDASPPCQTCRGLW